MKATSIRIRIEEAEKQKIEAFANKVNKSVSEIVRRSIAAAISAEVPGTRERSVCAAARRSANQVLDILQVRPVDVGLFRTAVIDLRAAACELVQRS